MNRDGEISLLLGAYTFIVVYGMTLLSRAKEPDMLLVWASGVQLIALSTWLAYSILNRKKSRGSKGNGD